ncbi:hypothetical protein N0V83_004301 [Neocucurbitaria cava]|uniref:Pentatricopeptide repeat-containing protein n=1 Tax=Neocucurbitaria cava TaxID=798079 RepID=A0A9W8YDG4_9PLEO|nr:hypothetical protein N0V83_004301 [Neocucurbitaria cava]
MFLSGKDEQALKEWEQDHSLDCARHDYEPEHLEAGARLHALAGNADRAREVMEKLYALYPDWDPSVMMTVFRAHTSSASEQHHKLAKDIYKWMKEKRGNEVSIDDYDSWLVGFLEAQHLHYAKLVFRDMIKNERLITTGSAEHIEEVLKRLHMLYRLGDDISKMTSIALDLLSVLPQAYHLHVFGDWMKSAVVHKAPGAAAQILDMMFQRGSKPQTFHFNMLLEALLRTKEDPNILKAENIGWRMIEEASKPHKEAMRSDSTTEIISKRHKRKKRPATTDAARKVPKADVATLALIMHHHAQNLQWEHVDYLARQLKQTSIEPNTMIMNVLIDNKCRQGAYVEAFAIYKALTSPIEGNSTVEGDSIIEGNSTSASAEDIFPDGATIRCLWKTLRLALSSKSFRDDPNLPSPRDLLKETVSWWTLSRSRYDASRFLQGLAGADHGAITALMLHCFSFTSDLPGSLIVLHVLRHKFDIFPTDKVAEILRRQVAWVDLTTETKAVRIHFAQQSRNGSGQREREKVARVYEILRERRMGKMGLGGKGQDRMGVEEMGDVELNLLSEFVRVVLKRRHPPDVVEAMLDDARKSVGLPDLPTGDLDAFEVA